MPWTSNDADRHTHKATTSELKELWAKVANERLEHTGDEARAIREANVVVGEAKLAGNPISTLSHHSLPSRRARRDRLVCRAPLRLSPAYRQVARAASQGA
jgi:hypothetical protein